MTRHPSDLVFFLQKSSNLLNQLIEDAAQRWQLSTPEMRILLFLDQMPEKDTARDVALYCGMSKASVSGNVLKLATRGLLTVDVDLKDRRFQHLTLTEQADSILNDSRVLFAQTDAQLLGILEKEEQQQFLTLLRKMNCHLGCTDTLTTNTSETGKD
ncbi:MAG: winged helix-turn-helix transcriptional regulator [Oscillospiraceae bacterium]|nr:winged helix-turn-helix transcriptional regulator [Oscillospiraceae bacterium]